MNQVTEDISIFAFKGMKITSPWKALREEAATSAHVGQWQPKGRRGFRIADRFFAGVKLKACSFGLCCPTGTS